jgi:hypothetical protein
MSQQFPPNGGRGPHNGRGPAQGGRGPARGGRMVIPQQQQQQPPHQTQQQQQQQPPQTQQYNSYPAGGRDRGGSRPIGVWQQPQQQGSSLQQAASAAAAGGYQVGQQPPPVQGHGRPMPATGGYAPMGTVPYYHPYAVTGGGPHPGQWQGQPAYMAAPHQQSTARGQMYYPPTGQPVVPAMMQGTMPQSQVSQPIAPREKKPLIITVR